MTSLILAEIFKAVAIAIGAGSTTVLVAQSFAAIKDRLISLDEQNLIGVVMVVVRMSIILLFLTQAWTTAFHFLNPYTSVTISSSADVLVWFLLSIIFITFVFVDYKFITRQIGVSIQVTSWYALVFVTAWPSYISLNIEAFLLTFITFTIFSIVLIQKTQAWFINTQNLKKN